MTDCSVMHAASPRIKCAGLLCLLPDEYVQARMASSHGVLYLAALKMLESQSSEDLKVSE